MATATGFTKERMLQIEKTTVVAGRLVGDHLILTTREGVDIDVGNVRGPAGTGGGSAGQVVEKNFAAALQTWTFQHNLGTKGVVVKTFDPTGHEFEGEVTYPDINTVQVDFYYPQTGLMRVFT